MKLDTGKKSLFYHWNYAHRGLHTQDKTVPENSLAAFQAAHDAGYGAELDVQLSKDGQVVVFHDDTLDRVTGVHGRVDAFTYDELSKMPLCGTDQTIPLFTEVLKTFYGAGPLIVELKTGPRNQELCEKTYEILKTYPGLYCIESFNPFIVQWFYKNAPDVVRGQLAAPYQDMKAGGQKAPVAWALSRCLFSFLNHPHFIAYKNEKRPWFVRRQFAHGTMPVAWTSRIPDVDQKINDMVIVEFYRPEKKY